MGSRLLHVVDRPNECIHFLDVCLSVSGFETICKHVFFGRHVSLVGFQKVVIVDNPCLVFSEIWPNKFVNPNAPPPKCIPDCYVVLGIQWLFVLHKTPNQIRTQYEPISTRK